MCPQSFRSAQNDTTWTVTETSKKELGSHMSIK
jgi:hypothetical protein